MRLGPIPRLRGRNAKGHCLKGKVREIDTAGDGRVAWTYALHYNIRGRQAGQCIHENQSRIKFCHA